MTARLLAITAGLLVAAMILVDLIGARTSERDYISGLTRQLAEKGRLIAVEVAGGIDAANAAKCRAMAREADARLTIVGRDGRVLLDSQADAAHMENHGNREEIQAALRNRMGSSTRQSATTGVNYLYVAVPIPAGALRLAMPLSEVNQQVNSIRRRMLGLTVLAFLPAFLTAVFFARHLQRAVQQLAREHTELERLERIRKDFVINVSHELRTPLAAIQGYTETLLDGALEDRANNMRFLGIIRQNAERLANLTADLLTLSRIELGRQNLQMASCDLLRIVEEAFDTVRPMADKKRIRLAIQTGPGPAQAYCDSEAMYQVLVNLLDNALKYTPEGGSITVGAEPTAGGAIEVFVRDTGVGIPAEDVERLFERFYRVDKARSRELGGTGLGLAIVKHLVRAHGSDVRVESALGQGSTFFFTLPAGPPRTEPA